MKSLFIFAATSLSAALLAACGSGSQIAPSGPVQNARQLNGQSVGRASTLIVQGGRLPAHTDHRKSWMSPEAKNDKLLYISDVATNDVNVYSYPQGAMVGQLTGFNEPQGECVSDVGNVYITNTLDSDILEYAHGGTTPINTFSDPGQYPVGCSISKYLGKLAVANIMSVSAGPGSISTYGYHPGTFYDPSLYRMEFLGYDKKAPLFVAGTNAKGAFRYAKMEVLGHFLAVNLKDSITAPAGIQFSGRRTDMAVGDSTGTIYLARGPNILGTTTVNDTCSLGQFFITKSKVIVPEACNGSVGIYPYPAGGSPMKIITEGLSEPVGAALSL